ncbi:MAG: peroxiredoxin [Verrucomicrobiota bacterium]|jgi:peroxiredoxin Q/BCP
MRSLLIVIMFSLTSLLGLAADKLAVGARVPSLTVNDQDGKPVALADVGSKGYLLVYFYPKANTPGCTKQGCSLRDGWSDLQKAGVQILGVSTDDEAAQKKFRDEYSFPFRLLADHEKKVTEAFGVKNLVGMASRSAFLFKDGTCVWVDPKGSTADQAAQVLAYLKTAKP